MEAAPAREREGLTTNGSPAFLNLGSVWARSSAYSMTKGPSGRTGSVWTSVELRLDVLEFLHLLFQCFYLFLSRSALASATSGVARSAESIAARYRSMLCSICCMRAFTFPWVKLRSRLLTALDAPLQRDQYPRQSFGQEVGTSHPVFERAKRMFNGLSATPHHRRIIFQPNLHRIDYGFMLPALYPALLTRRTLLVH